MVARIFRLPMRAICSALAFVVCTVSAAQNTHAGSPERVSASATTPTVMTWWLSNGMRIVTVTNPRDLQSVSIRLLVADGWLRVPASQQALPHLVEHLAFPDLYDTDVRSWFPRAGGHANGFTGTFSIGYEFDVPAAAAERTLQQLRAQWDGQPFAADAFEREVRRIRHELYFTETPTLQRLAGEFAPGSILDRSSVDEEDALGDVDVEDAWAHFRETHVGARMTLLVVAPSSLMQELHDSLLAFSDLPAGDPAPAPRLGDVSWIQGVLSETQSETDNSFGLWFSVPDSLSALDRLLVTEAAHSYLDEELSYQRGYSYGSDLSTHRSSAFEVWTFTSYADFDQQSRDELHEEAERALRALASEASRDWWEAFAQGLATRVSWWYTDSMTLADAIVAQMCLEPHDRRVTAPPEAISDAAHLHDQYRKIVDSAHFFRVMQAPERSEDTSPRPPDRNTALVGFAHWVQDWYAAQIWSFCAVLVLMFSMFAVFVRVLDHGLQRIWRRVRGAETIARPS